MTSSPIVSSQPRPPAWGPLRELTECCAQDPLGHAHLIAFVLAAWDPDTQQQALHYTQSKLSRLTFGLASLWDVLDHIITLHTQARVLLSNARIHASFELSPMLANWSSALAWVAVHKPQEPNLVIELELPIPNAKDSLRLRHKTSQKGILTPHLNIERTPLHLSHHLSAPFVRILDASSYPITWSPPPRSWRPLLGEPYQPERLDLINQALELDLPQVALSWVRRLHNQRMAQRLVPITLLQAHVQHIHLSFPPHQDNVSQHLRSQLQTHIDAVSSWLSPITLSWMDHPQSERIVCSLERESTNLTHLKTEHDRNATMPRNFLLECQEFLSSL